MMNSKILTLIFSLLILPVNSVMSQESLETVEDTIKFYEQFTDPDFARLSPGFIIRSRDGHRKDGYFDPEQIAFSTKMDMFINSFELKYSTQFIDDDVQKIRAHIATWWDDQLAIHNEINAYTYKVLHRIDQMSYEELVRGGVYENVDAIESIEEETGRLFTEHHMTLLNSLSEQGSTDVMTILDGEIADRAIHNLSTGVVSGSKFDLRRFTEAYPEVMSRQLVLEQAMREATGQTGPPSELVYKNVEAGTSQGGQQQRAIIMAPKEE